MQFSVADSGSVLLGGSGLLIMAYGCYILPSFANRSSARALSKYHKILSSSLSYVCSWFVIPISPALSQILLWWHIPVAWPSVKFFHGIAVRSPGSNGLRFIYCDFFFLLLWSDQQIQFMACVMCKKYLYGSVMWGLMILELVCISSSIGAP